VQISAKELENIYNGTMPVQELREEGWFKYTIGHYKTWDEAEKLLNQVKVARAFIVAYKNGKRVPLKDAIDPFERQKH
jgi:hypothetical protein